MTFNKHNVVGLRPVHINLPFLCAQFSVAATKGSTLATNTAVSSANVEVVTSSNKGKSTVKNKHRIGTQNTSLRNTRLYRIN